LLASVTFHADAEGTSPLDLPMLALTNPLGTDIDAYRMSGSVEVSSSSGAALPGGPEAQAGALAFAVALTGMLGLLLRPSLQSLPLEMAGRPRRERLTWVARDARRRFERIVKSLKAGRSDGG
jgi:hypothetical protein